MRILTTILALCPLVCNAEEYQPPPPLPSVVITPMEYGWVLTYSNQLTYKANPLEYDTRMVSLDGVEVGSIDWSLDNTPNGDCDTPCPGTITILSVPEGYTSDVSSLVVDEGETVMIFIYPDVGV